MKRYKVFSLWEYLFLFFFLFLSLTLFYLSQQSLSYKAYNALKNKKVAEAQTYFKEAIEKDPSQPLNYLNLALSYDLNKQNKKTEEIYKEAVSRFKDKDRISFYLYHNKGEFYSRSESKPDKALQAYQKALKLNYQITRIKKNIEWLFKNQKKEKTDSEGKSQEEGSSEKNEQDNKQEKQNQKEGDKTNSENKNQRDEEESNEGGEEKKDEESNQGGEESNEEEDSKQEESKQGEEERKDQEKTNEEEDNKKEPNENKEGQTDQGESDQEEEGDRLEEENLSKSSDFDRSQEINEKAILEEIQKQESKARSRFYKGKRTFGDKTDKNW